MPVASFVLYFGTGKRWSKKKTIKELMKVPDELDPYINDYKINVVEIAWLTEEQLKMFRSDFGIVANFFVQKRKNKDYEPDDTREIQHVDAVLKLLSVMTKDDRYKNVLYQAGKEKVEVKTMCEVAERLENRGKREGKIEAKLESVLECLEELGDIPETLREKIMSENNLEQFTKWLKLAVRVDSIDEFIEKM